MDHLTLKEPGSAPRVQPRPSGEKVSGAKSDCALLSKAFAALPEGDILLVTRLDRLARTIRSILNVLATIADKGDGFPSLSDARADTTTARSTDAHRAWRIG
jgi:DNA invertase Pin-like site-specific DNA recombinase